MTNYLQKFADISKESKEYQGHGWGCAYLQDDALKTYHDINPVWEDDFSRFPETTLFIAHARSAFRDEGITVENNMPFFDGTRVFAFNGELQGVRIRSEGRIGAEKIFNVIKRFGEKNMQESLSRAMNALEKRTRYIRALNCIIADTENLFLATIFNEDPEYFQMHEKKGDCHIICSQPFHGESGWIPIPNRKIMRLSLC